MELKGKRILVVEDDYYLADEVCQELRREGAVVLGPAPTPFYALQLLGRRGVDGAVLDVHLHGKTVFGLADELVRRGTPIVFATAYGEDVFPERHKRSPRLIKPFRREELIEHLSTLGQPPTLEDRQLSPSSRTTASRTGFAEETPQVRMVRAICAVMRQNAVEHRRSLR
ncbi:response regulator [Devosia sp. PTR5]|uniref:Response regulator n=1 Tax=Devosia oryzisoli TaxID=2774138 RepID=A0A927ITV3_9HYPH|nr:response regulator [Devosia oryzisoli]MBD8066934.1 response regulator [Devosia oryzisoli]